MVETTRGTAALYLLPKGKADIYVCLLSLDVKFLCPLFLLVCVGS